MRDCEVNDTEYTVYGVKLFKKKDTMKRNERKNLQQYDI